MALRNEDKVWIRDEIKTAIDGLNPHGWRRLSNFLREWGIAGTNLTIIVALLGLAASQFYYANQRIKQEAEFETNTKNDLQSLKSDVQSIHTQLTQQALRSQSALPLDEFKQTLPTLASDILAARQQKVSVAPHVIGAIQQKLMATKDDTPGYWPAAAQVVNYRSETAIGWNRINMPNCSEENITFGVTHAEQLPNGHALLTHELATFHHCALILDSPEAQSLMNKGLSVGNVTFDDCIIVYNGGPIILKPIKYPGENPPLIGDTINFVKCIFLFKLDSTPPPSGQHLTTELLAANTDTVRFNPVG